MTHSSFGFLLRFTLCGFATFSCSPPPEKQEVKAAVEASSENDSYDDQLAKLNSTLQEAETLAGVSIPILASPSLQKTWGKPSIRTSPEGSYELYYTDPERSFESLVITGSPVALVTLDSPPPVATMDATYPQEWQTTKLMGKTIRTYVEAAGGGADGEVWATEFFPLTSPQGTKGFYRITMEFNTEEAPNRLSQVAWQK